MASKTIRRFALHGWVGLLLVALFWPLNWYLPAFRTHWAFFPLWLGYSLVVDALGLRRRGTSLAFRGAWAYAGLFLISAPLWWLFEAINLRTRNWHYLGREAFGDLEYALWATLSFSTVVPAVLGTAEWVAGSRFVERFRDGPRLGGNAGWMIGAGLGMLTLMLIWPRLFFPLVWISLFFVFDGWNHWRGNVSLFGWIRVGDWRPLVALAGGALICGFFWELWNYYSYPKWIYSVAPFDFWRLFEMPLAGYLGYPPFALELFAAVHLVYGCAGRGRSGYVTSGLAR